MRTSITAYLIAGLAIAVSVAFLAVPFEIDREAEHYTLEIVDAPAG